MKMNDSEAAGNYGMCNILKKKPATQLYNTQIKSWLIFIY